MNISNYLLIEDLKSSNNVDRDQHLKHLVYHKVSKYSSSDQLQLDYKINQDGTEMKIFNITEFIILHALQSSYVYSLQCIDSNAFEVRIQFLA